MKINIIIIFIIITAFNVLSQDVEQVIKSRPFRLTGGLNTSATFYASNSENKRDPFIWIINGNMNLNFYGVVDAPFSFMISKENKTFNQPSYKQFGISPKYKALTVHLGYRAMNFSQFTMSGIQFLGGGIEYAPKNKPFAIKGFYGRFAQAVQYQSIASYDPNAIVLQPAFERWGYGSMVTIGKKGQFVDFIFFKAIDDKNSINVPDTIDNLKPVENFVLGINTRNKITKDLNFRFEFALSALSTDIRQPEINQETYSYSNNLGFLFSPRTSSQFNKVFNTGLDYKFRFANVGVSYKRIDPEFKSLGTSFINNDIEEITANLATSFFKNKMSFSGNFGTQKNNLDNAQLTTNKRFITSANLTYLATQKLNFVASLSNFNTNSTPTQVYLVDSIKYSQATSNFGLTTNYNFGDTTLQQGITFLTSYQMGNTLNKSGTAVTDISNTFFNTNLMYRLGFIPQKMSVFVSVNYSSFKSEGITTNSVGPTIGLTQQFLQGKLKIGLNSTYLSTTGTNTSSLINVRAYGNYSVNKHHSFKLGVSVLNKNANNTDVTQFQGNVAYAFVF